MNNMETLFSEFSQNMQISEVGGETTFEELWNSYTSLLNLVGTKFIESNDLLFENVANEVRLHLERHEYVSRIIAGINLLVPRQAQRTIYTFGNYLSETKNLHELAYFLQHVSAFTEVFSEYAANHLGRAALPIKHSLELVTKSSIMLDFCVKNDIALINNQL